jgi:hypothetical protein
MNNKKFKKPLAARFRPAVATFNIEAVVVSDMTSEMFARSAWCNVHRRVRVPLYRIINDQVQQVIPRWIIKQNSTYS